MHLRLVTALAAQPFLLSAVWAADQSSASLSSVFGADFWEKVTIALVAAVFGFTANYVLAQVKARKEPRKQLSYDSEVRKGLVTVEEKISEKIKVLYGGQEIRNLFHVACNLQNSGNTVVKNQYVRFDFGGDTTVVDEYVDPPPEPEVGVQTAPIANLAANEKRFLISHLEKEQRVGFRFIISADTAPKLALHPYNEEGNVEFLPRAVTVEADEMYHVSSFLRLVILFWILPPTLYVIPFGLGSDAAGLVRLGIIAVMLPHLKPFVSVVSHLVANLAMRRSIESRVQIVDLKQVDVLDITTESKG